MLLLLTNQSALFQCSVRLKFVHEIGSCTVKSTKQAKINKSQLCVRLMQMEARTFVVRIDARLMRLVRANLIRWIVKTGLNFDLEKSDKLEQDQSVCLWWWH